MFFWTVGILSGETGFFRTEFCWSFFFVTFGVNIRKYPLYCLVLKMSVNKPSLPRREAVGGELVTKDIVSGCRR